MTNMRPEHLIDRPHAAACTIIPSSRLPQRQWTHQPMPNHLSLPTNQRHPRRHGWAPYFNVSAKFNPRGSSVRSTRNRLICLIFIKHDKSMTNLRPLPPQYTNGVSSPSFYSSSTGAEPRATSNLIQHPYARMDPFHQGQFPSVLALHRQIYRHGGTDDNGNVRSFVKATWLFWPLGLAEPPLQYQFLT